MKYWLMVAVIFTIIIPAVVSAEILEKVKPGDKTIDLGDGYKVSFVLDDAFKNYDIDVSEPKKNVFGTGYGFSIYPAGETDEIFSLGITITPEPELITTFGESSEFYDGMTTVTIPVTIDKSSGSTNYCYMGDKAKNPEESITAAFMYYPGSTKRTDMDLAVDGRITVQGQIPFKESGISEEYPLFKAILDCIHLTGPGI